MAKITLMGDIHGDLNKWVNAIADAEQSVQIGDFGVGFFPDEMQDELEQFLAANPQHRFIRGNHDNPALCKSMEHGYIPDGTVEVFEHNGTVDAEIAGLVARKPPLKIMYIGGAHSIDKQYRLANGLKWWEEEELSYAEQLEIYDKYVAERPDVVISHDAPQTAIQQIMFTNGPYWHQQYYPSMTQKFLDALWRAYKPYLWFFGHWHINTGGMVGDTEFVCLDINQTYVLDTKRVAKEIETYEQGIAWTNNASRD